MSDATSIQVLLISSSNFGCILERNRNRPPSLEYGLISKWAPVVFKVSNKAKVTLTLKTIDKKATFDIADNDVTTKDVDNEPIKANWLPISEKSFLFHLRRSA